MSLIALWLTLLGCTLASVLAYLAIHDEAC